MVALFRVLLAAAAVAFALTWSAPAQAQCDGCSPTGACPVFPSCNSALCPSGSGQCYAKVGGGNFCGVANSAYCSDCTATSCPPPFQCMTGACCGGSGKACAVPCSSCLSVSGCFCD